MGHKIKSCSYKNTAARNARALQKSQEGPKPVGVGHRAVLIASAMARLSAPGINASAIARERSMYPSTGGTGNASPTLTSR